MWPMQAIQGEFKVLIVRNVLNMTLLTGNIFVKNFFRAILVKDQKPLQMSFDFTPESERERIKYMGLIRPELLGDEFTYLEFIRRPTLSDVGKSILCRDAYMSGW